MTPGDVVRCVDDRYSEGRLVKGRMYVVKEARHSPAMGEVNPDVPNSEMGIRVMGVNNCAAPEGVKVYWKSSRFVPVNRKDLETEILAKVADKIMGGAENVR